MLPEIRDEARLRAAFRWNIPDFYNIGVDVCDRWAAVAPQRPAILDMAADGSLTLATYGDLRLRSNRLASALKAQAIGVGDRVGILLPQSIGRKPYRPLQNGSDCFAAGGFVRCRGVELSLAGCGGAGFDYQCLRRPQIA